MARAVTRRAFVALCAAGIAGCAGDGGGDDNPALGDVEGRGALSLSSPAFEDGGPIPEKYGRSRANVNPPLRIGGVPAGAESLALIVDDPDAVEPAGEVWLHWLVWNVDPSRREIPEGWEPRDATVGRNDFGERGYGGPQPPDGVHTYRFKLYAVGTALDLGPDASKREVGEAMAGDVLAAAQLEGTYGPT